MKIEISNRDFNDHYEIKNILGIDMKVLALPDMFAHQLCALLDRNETTNRDVFDCWFFLQRKTPVNPEIVETRMQASFNDYLQQCIDTLEKMSDKGLLNGLGELTTPEIKSFVRTKLRTETISLLRFFKEFPIIAKMK